MSAGLKVLKGAKILKQSKMLNCLKSQNFKAVKYVRILKLSKKNLKSKNGLHDKKKKTIFSIKRIQKLAKCV